MRSPSHESYSDFQTDQTTHTFHDLDAEIDLYRITNGFHGAFATGLARLPFLGLAYAPIVETSVPELAVSFHIENASVLSRVFLLVAFCVVILLPFFFNLVGIDMIQLFPFLFGNSHGNCNTTHANTVEMYINFVFKIRY